MQTASVLLVCLLVTCSVWIVHGRSIEINIDDQEDVEISVKLPGVCWACKWSLNKVKKAVGHNPTVEKLKSKLSSICDHIRHLKSVCRRYVKAHFAELVKELSTNADVRTICVHTGACKSMEMQNLLFYPSYNPSSIDINEWRYMDD